MNETYRRVMAMCEWRPHLAFEDVPISLALYPFLHVESNALVVRGTGQRRDGKRWGMSATWERGHEHYMVPSRLVVSSAAAHGGMPDPTRLNLTTAQPFDFVYEPFELEGRLRRTKHARSSEKNEGLRFDRIKARHWAWAIESIFKEQGFELPEGGHEAFVDLLEFADELEQFECLGAFLDHELIGFAMLWHEHASPDDLLAHTTFVAHRCMRRSLRRHTQLFDSFIAGVAWVNGSTELNRGDALRLPGVASYKLAMRPVRLDPYVNFLERAEAMDHECRAD